MFTTHVILSFSPFRMFPSNTIYFNLGTDRVQKQSRLHGSEPEENFAIYVVFEEDFEICINNPVSAKLSYNATSTVKGIAYLR